MKKSEILIDVFGSRVVSYKEYEKNNMLVIELKDFLWSDLTPKMINSFIGIKPWTEDTIILILECNDFS